MRRKDGLPKKHGGGRKRTIFCDSCKVNPIPVKQCRKCQTKYAARLKASRLEEHLAKQREYYRRNREYLLKKKHESKHRSEEAWNSFLEKSRLYKSKVRYGEFAEAHLEFRKLIRQLKGKENGKTEETTSSDRTEQYHDRYDF